MFQRRNPSALRCCARPMLPCLVLFHADPKRPGFASCSIAELSWPAQLNPYLHWIFKVRFYTTKTKKNNDQRRQKQNNAQKVGPVSTKSATLTCLTCWCPPMTKHSRVIFFGLVLMKNHANVTLKRQLQAAPGTELHKICCAWNYTTRPPQWTWWKHLKKKKRFASVLPPNNKPNLIRLPMSR